MPIRLRNNPYRGVNAHLQSYLQSSGGLWHSYHATLIEMIRALLDSTLPPGYSADSEQSLQISALNNPALNPESPVRTITDVLISTGSLRSTESAPAPTLSSGYTPAPDVSLTLSVLDLVEGNDEDAPNAVVISAYGVDGRHYPVTRIELLSPSNKPPRHGYAVYASKRADTLKARICVVEIDLLHQSQPAIDVLPSYPDGDAHASAFTITISDPRPDLQAGQTFVYAFGVDQPVPRIHIPLQGTDYVPFDLVESYDEALRTKRSLYEQLDYSELPLAFDTYSPADQERIRTRMEAIRQSGERSETLKTDAT